MADYKLHVDVAAAVNGVKEVQEFKESIKEVVELRDKLEKQGGGGGGSGWFERYDREAQSLLKTLGKLPGALKSIQQIKGLKFDFSELKEIEKLVPNLIKSVQSNMSSLADGDLIPINSEAVASLEKLGQASQFDWLKSDQLANIHELLNVVGRIDDRFTQLASKGRLLTRIFNFAQLNNIPTEKLQFLVDGVNEGNFDHIKQILPVIENMKKEMQEAGNSFGTGSVQSLEQIQAALTSIVGLLTSVEEYISIFGDSGALGVFAQALTVIIEDFEAIKASLGTVNQEAGQLPITQTFANLSTTLDGVINKLDLINKKVGKTNLNFNIKNDQGTTKQAAELDIMWGKEYQKYMKKYQEMLGVANNNTNMMMYELFNVPQVGYQYDNGNQLIDAFSIGTIQNLPTMEAKVRRMMDFFKLYRKAVDIAREEYSEDFYRGYWAEMDEVVPKEGSAFLSNPALNAKIRKRVNKKYAATQDKDATKELTQNIQNALGIQQSADMSTLISEGGQLTTIFSELIAQLTTISELLQAAFGVKNTDFQFISPEAIQQLNESKKLIQESIQLRQEAAAAASAENTTTTSSAQAEAASSNTKVAADEKEAQSKKQLAEAYAVAAEAEKEWYTLHQRGSLTDGQPYSYTRATGTNQSVTRSFAYDDNGNLMQTGETLHTNFEKLSQEIYKTDKAIIVLEHDMQRMSKAGESTTGISTKLGYLRESLALREEELNRYFDSASYDAEQRNMFNTIRSIRADYVKSGFIDKDATADRALQLKEEKNTADQLIKTYNLLNQQYKKAAMDNIKGQATPDQQAMLTQYKEAEAYMRQMLLDQRQVLDGFNQTGQATGSINKITDALEKQQQIMSEVAMETERSQMLGARKQQVALDKANTKQRLGLESELDSTVKKIGDIRAKISELKASGPENSQLAGQFKDLNLQLTEARKNLVEIAAKYRDLYKSGGASRSDYKAVLARTRTGLSADNTTESTKGKVLDSGEASYERQIKFLQAISVLEQKNIQLKNSENQIGNAGLIANNEAEIAKLKEKIDLEEKYRETIGYRNASADQQLAAQTAAGKSGNYNAINSILEKELSELDRLQTRWNEVQASIIESKGRQDNKLLGELEAIEAKMAEVRQQATQTIEIVDTLYNAGAITQGQRAKARNTYTAGINPTGSTASIGRLEDADAAANSAKEKEVIQEVNRLLTEKVNILSRMTSLYTAATVDTAALDTERKALAANEDELEKYILKKEEAFGDAIRGAISKFNPGDNKQLTANLQNVYKNVNKEIDSFMKKLSGSGAHPAALKPLQDLKEAFSTEFQNLFSDLKLGKLDISQLQQFITAAEKAQVALSSNSKNFSGSLKGLSEASGALSKLESYTENVGKISKFSEEVGKLRTELNELYVEAAGGGNIDAKLNDLINRITGLRTNKSQYEQVNKNGKLVTDEGIMSQVSSIEQLQSVLPAYLRTLGYTNIELQKLSANGKSVVASARDQSGAYKTVTASLESELKTMRLLVNQEKSLKGFGSQAMTNFGGTLKGLASTTSFYFSSMALMTKFTSAVKEGIESTKTFDSALATISYTMNVTKEQLNDIGDGILNMSKDYGVSLDSAAKIYQIYANMNTTAQEIKTMAEPTAILSNLSGVDASTAADQIQGVLNQFDLQAESAMHVADVYNYISSQISVDYSKGIEGMASAVQNVGNVANAAGLSFEQLSSIIAKTMEQTRQDGSSIGTGLKTIMTRLSKASVMDEEVSNEDLSKASAVLHDIGVEVYTRTGEFREFDTIMTELAAKWDTLTEAQQANISFQIAATRQTATLKAILSNWSDSMDLATEATEESGGALKNQEKYLDSFAGKTQKISNETEEYWIGLFNRDGFKGFLDLINDALELINKLSDKIGHLPVLIGGIVGALSGLTFMKNTGKNLATNFFKNGGFLSWSQKQKAATGSGWTGLLGNALSGVKSRAFPITKASAADQNFYRLMNGASQKSILASENGVRDLADYVGASKELSSLYEQVQNGSKTIQQANAEARQLFKNIQSGAKGASGSLKGMGQAAKQLGSFFANLGLQALQMAAMAAVSAIINKISQLTVTAKEASKATQEMADASKQAVTTAKQHIDGVKAISDEYFNLRKEVNVMNNSNMSLSTENYDKYLEYTNQIAESFPELVSGYDAQGNAILRLTNGVNDLEAAYQAAERAAYALAFNNPDIENGTYSSIVRNYSYTHDKDYNDNMAWYEKVATATGLGTPLAWIGGDLAKNNGNWSNAFSDFFGEFTSGWNSLINKTVAGSNKSFEESVNILQNYIDNRGVGLTGQQYKQVADLLGSDVTKKNLLNATDSEIQSYMRQASTAIQELNSTTKTSLSNIKVAIAGYVKGISESYQGLVDAQDTLGQDLVNSVVNNLSEETIAKYGLTDETQLDQWVTRITTIAQESQLARDAFSSAMALSSKGFALTGEELDRAETYSNIISTLLDVPKGDMDDALGLSTLLETKKAFNNSIDGLRKNASEIDRNSSAYNKLSYYADTFTAAQMDQFNTATDGITSLSEAVKAYETSIVDAASSTKASLISISDYVDSSSGKIRSIAEAGATPNQGSAYDDLIEQIATGKELAKYGDIGTDDFKAIASFISPTGSTGIEDWLDNVKKADRYLTKDSNTGVLKFLDDLVKVGRAEFDSSDNSWTYKNLTTTKDLEDTARELGISKEFALTMFGELGDKNFYNDFFDTSADGYARMYELQREYNDGLVELNRLEARGDTEGYKRKAAELENISNELDQVSQATKDLKATEDMYADRGTSKLTKEDLATEKYSYEATQLAADNKTLGTYLDTMLTLSKKGTLTDDERNALNSARDSYFKLKSELSNNYDEGLIVPVTAEGTEIDMEAAEAQLTQWGEKNNWEFDSSLSLEDQAVYEEIQRLREFIQQPVIMDIDVDPNNTTVAGKSILAGQQIKNAVDSGNINEAAAMYGQLVRNDELASIYREAGVDMTSLGTFVTTMAKADAALIEAYNAGLIDEMYSGESKMNSDGKESGKDLAKDKSEAEELTPKQRRAQAAKDAIDSNDLLRQNNEPPARDTLNRRKPTQPRPLSGQELAAQQAARDRNKMTLGQWAKGVFTGNWGEEKAPRDSLIGEGGKKVFKTLSDSIKTFNENSKDLNTSMLATSAKDAGMPVLSKLGASIKDKFSGLGGKQTTNIEATVSNEDKVNQKLNQTAEKREAPIVAKDENTNTVTKNLDDAAKPRTATVTVRTAETKVAEPRTTTATTKVTADTSGVSKAVSSAKSTVSKSSAAIKIDANTAPANAKLSQISSTVNNTTSNLRVGIVESNLFNSIKKVLDRSWDINIHANVQGLATGTLQTAVQNSGRVPHSGTSGLNSKNYAVGTMAYAKGSQVGIPEDQVSLVNEVG